METPPIIVIQTMMGTIVPGIPGARVREAMRGGPLRISLCGRHVPNLLSQTQGITLITVDHGSLRIRRQHLMPLSRG
jgi:hypothetical protein